MKYSLKPFEAVLPAQYRTLPRNTCMPIQLNQDRTEGLKPDRAVHFGNVPESHMTLIREALNLNGRLNLTLSSHEIQLLDVAQRELQIYGVSISYEPNNDVPGKRSTGTPNSQAEKVLSRRSRVVTVVIKLPPPVVSTRKELP
jgi:hypothetical protein